MSIKRDSAVRRLLVITYHFPPDGAIGGQRWAGLSKYLARLGWEVHVITASAPGLEPSPPNVHRYFRARRRTLNDFYRAGVGRFRRPARQSQQASASSPGLRTQSASVRPLAALRRVVGSAMYLPDHGRGWVGRAARSARTLLRDARFDLVVTCGPPHSSHFAGLLATTGTGVPFWIDMRDPWSMTHEMQLTLDRFIQAERFFLRRLEKFIYGRAARVVVNTREFASALRAAEPGLDVIHFPNGIDLEGMPARDVDAVRHGSIAHVGALYARRNLSSLFAAMRSLLNDRPQAASVLRLDIAGPLDSPHRERMHDEIAAAGLTSIVNVHGVIAREQALALLTRSHLALVLAQDQPLCIPAKLYESIGLGVPTVVIAEAGSAAAHEARRIGAMTFEDDDVGGLRSMLEDLLDGRIPLRIVPNVSISYEDLALQMDGLLRERTSR
jgi:glycosyltransferase involved in cell wall biosynthesis